MARPEQLKLSNNNKQASAATSNASPPPQEINDFHMNSDVDSRNEAQHHTLGPFQGQASPGDHIHDGGTSSLLLTGQTLTGSRASDAWRLSIEAALIRLGASSNSTA